MDVTTALAQMVNRYYHDHYVCNLLLGAYRDCITFSSQFGAIWDKFDFTFYIHN